jgi:phosphoglycolate phosphatase
MGHLLTSSTAPDAIVFDLDGTLIDSVPEVAAALNHVLADFGRRQLSVSETLDMVGEGAVATLEHAFTATGAALDDDQIPKVMSTYLSTYKDARGANTVIYPGVRPVLEQLRSSGVAMSICTNKPAATTTATLEGLELLAYFPRVVCPEDTLHRKPDGRHVLDCLNFNGANPARAVLVGDSETDMAAARDAGIGFIAVSYGYSHVPIEDLGADAVIDHFPDLMAALRELYS